MNQSIKVNVTVQVTANKHTVNAVLKPIIGPKSAHSDIFHCFSIFCCARNFFTFSEMKNSKIQIENFKCQINLTDTFPQFVR